MLGVFGQKFAGATFGRPSDAAAQTGLTFQSLQNGPNAVTTSGFPSG